MVLIALWHSFLWIFQSYSSDFFGFSIIIELNLLPQIHSAFWSVFWSVHAGLKKKHQLQNSSTWAEIHCLIEESKNMDPRGFNSSPIEGWSSSSCCPKCFGKKKGKCFRIKSRYLFKNFTGRSYSLFPLPHTKTFCSFTACWHLSFWSLSQLWIDCIPVPSSSTIVQDQWVASAWATCQNG